MQFIRDIATLCGGFMEGTVPPHCRRDFPHHHLLETAPSISNKRSHKDRRFFTSTVLAASASTALPSYCLEAGLLLSFSHHAFLGTFLFLKSLSWNLDSSLGIVRCSESQKPVTTRSRRVQSSTLRNQLYCIWKMSFRKSSRSLLK